MKRFAFLLASTLFSILIFAAITFGQVSLTTIDTASTQNFDSLANVGTNITWTNNTTIPGWYSSRTTYNSGTGSSNTGALYSFGATASTERALGGIASGTTGTFFWGVRLVNNTGQTITSLDVSFIGEQWRDGGAAVPASQDMTFDYMVSPTPITDITTGTYTTLPALTFTSPTFTNTGSGVALDGNLAANRTAKSNTITVTILPGEEIMLRWTDINNGGNDHGLAVDDFSVTPHGAPASNIDLSVTRTADQSTIALNDPVTYTLTVSNGGTSTANNVRATFVVPAGLTYSSSTVNGGFTASESMGTVTFDGGTVPNGGSVVLTVTATATTQGIVATSATTGVTVDPLNTITETNEMNNNAPDAVEVRVLFPSTVTGLFGRPSLAQLMADIADIGGAQLVVLNSNLTNENSTINVPSGITIDFGSFVVTGTGNFVFNTNTGIRTSHPNGIGDATHPGNIQTTGATVFNADSDFTYYTILTLTELGAEQIAYGMPANIDDFRINNPNGLQIVAPFTVNGDFYLQNGIVNNGTNTITLSIFSRINGDNNGEGTETSFVAGIMTKLLSSTPPVSENGIATGFVFPVGTIGGTDNGYSPLKLQNYITNGIGNSLTVQAFDANLPGVSAPSISRYWQITETGDVTTSLNFNWRTGEDSAITVPADVRIFRGTSNACNMMVTNCTINLPGRTATITGVSDFSPWGLAQINVVAAGVIIGGRVRTTDGTGLPNALVTLIAPSGAIRTVRTSSFGYFSFDDLEAGDTYVLQVEMKQRIFSPQVIVASEDATNIEFIPQE